MGIVAGIVTKNSFVVASAKSKAGKKIDYGGYVDYTGRKEAIKKTEMATDKMRSGDYVDSYDDYENYVDGYMNNEFKTEGRGLFNKDYDNFSPNQYQEVKNVFRTAQKNGAPLWQDVVSFDNRWLEKNGLYDSTTHTVNEEELQEAIRSGVQAMLAAEKLENSAVWYASIHYNTDNIHVHIASVEPNPSPSRWMEDKQAYRGKRKPSSTALLKSKVANHLLNRSQEQAKINDLIRNGMVQKKKETNLALDKATKSLFLLGYSKLPPNKREWSYGYSIDEARPYIDEISKIFLEKHMPEEMEELEKRLDQEVEVMRETYGSSSQADQYKENKKQELYKRMGNAVLQEMRNYDNELQRIEKAKEYQKNNGFDRFKPSRFRQNWIRHGELDRSIRQLHYQLKKGMNDYQKNRNLDEFDRMLEGRE